MERIAAGSHNHELKLQNAKHQSGHACGDATRQHAAEHRSQSKLSQIATALGSQWSDTADLNTDGTEV